MRKWLTIVTVTVISTLMLIVVGLSVSNNNLKKDIADYANNFKALSLEKDKITKEAIAYRFSIEQLEYINDSIIEDLNNTRKQLKIKDQEILQMQSIKTEISTKDSVFIKDTIFRDSFVGIDTTIKDKWHTLAISLKPNNLKISAKYVSDLSVFAKTSKEIVGTPKKCFIGRWFQKKHNVVRVEVYDKCPYSVIKEKKFVIIE
jgi:hypothetical protein